MLRPPHETSCISFIKTSAHLLLPPRERGYVSPREASRARSPSGCSVLGSQARGWIFCEKNLWFDINRESGHHAQIVQCTHSDILHKSPLTKIYFDTKKRRLPFYRRNPSHFANTPFHHPIPWLIPPTPPRPEH
jgi:hypothetical protein